MQTVVVSMVEQHDLATKPIKVSDSTVDCGGSCSVLGIRSLTVRTLLREAAFDMRRRSWHVLNRTISDRRTGVPGTNRR